MSDIPTVSGPDYPKNDGPISLPIIKGYKIIKQLGEGGMGIVYLAEQTERIKRQVALKIVKPGMDSKQVIARFEAERQALALLDHPNIAHVYDAGTTEKGWPYFVMEYVDGIRITDYCDEKKLSIEERLKLFIQVCEAIQHAHQKGIIHRDIKPSNILVSVQDNKPILKVIDFGVAKALRQQLTEKTMFTEQGQFIGTPEYMSPEQADLTSQDIDTRTDVYSLGVLLYELLTGALPFDPERLREAAFEEIQRTIREEEPPRPSTRVSSLHDEAAEIAISRSTQINTLVKSLHRELEWIPLRAMRKERERRYQSATDLAEDIVNYLAGNPLAAGPESRTYRIKKYVRRNRVLVTSTTVIVLVLLIGIIASTFFAIRAEKERIIAEHNRETAEKAKMEETKQRQIAEQEQIKATEAKKEAEKQADIAKQEKIRAEEKALELQQQMYANKIAAAQKAFEDAAANETVEVLLSCSEELRHWEWYYLWKVTTTGQIWTYDSEKVVKEGLVQTDWRLPLGIYEDPTFLGDALKKFDSHTPMVEHVEFSNDSKCLFIMNPEGAISSRDFTGKVESAIKIWDIESGKEIKQIKIPDSTIRSFCVEPNGARIAISTNKEVIITDSNGTVLKKQNAHGKSSYHESKEIAWSPDGKYIAFETRIAHDNVGVIGIWDTDENKVIHTITPKDKQERTNPEIRRSLAGSEYDIHSLAFSPDSKLLFAGTNFSWTSNRTLRVWDVKTGKEKMLFGDQNFIITILCFSPDGKYLADLRQDEEWTGAKTVRMWDLRRGVVKQVLEGHSGAVTGVSYSHDGRRIVTTSDDGTIRIWNTDTGTELFRMGSLKWGFLPMHQARFSPDGRSLAIWGQAWSGERGNTVRILTAACKEDVKKWQEDQIKKVQQKKAAEFSEAHDFLGAIQTGDVAKLNDFLVQEKYWREYTSYPLSKAIAQGAHPNTIKLFIERGANVNEGIHGSLLNEVIEQNSLEILEVLIKEGADINAKGRNNYTPLHVAALKGKKDVVNFLIEKGADLNAVEHIDTALTMALEKGHFDIAELLINKGAEVNIGNARALQLAGKQNEIKDLLVKNGAVECQVINTFKNDIGRGNTENVKKIIQKYPQLVHWIDYPGETPIFRAIQNGNPEMVRFLISKGSEINILNSNGQAPIHYVARQGKKEILQVLIENSANVNLQTTESLQTYTGCTPLHWAVLSGHKEIIDILLKNGADINTRTRFGYTPLHMATKTTLNDQKEIMEVLLKSGADINAQTRLGDTPLLLAVKTNNKEIVLYLLSRGADVSIPNKSARTPVDLAKMKELRTILITQGGLQASDLLDAVKAEELDKIRAILTRNLDLAYARPGSAPNCAFIEAIAKNKIQIVRLFIQAGVDVNHRAVGGDPALEIALGYKIDPEIAKLLIENGADVNIRDRYSQRTMLHKAIVKRDSEIINIMLEKGADANMKIEYFGSPLNSALSYIYNRETIQSFIDNGADISGDKGIKYLEKAVELENSEAVYVLLENGVDIEGEKGRALFQKAFQREFHCDPKIIEYLITHGTDFKGIKNNFGQSVLHYALTPRRIGKNIGNGIIFNIHTVETGSINIEFVKDLIRKKADLNIKDKYNGMSPLHYALQSENIELVRLLLDNGAGVNTQDKDGKTLFHSTIPWNNEKIFELLLRKGADINRPNNDGLTPLQHAVFHHPDITKTVIAKGGTSHPVLIDTVIKENVEKVKAQILLDPNEINLLDKAGNSLLHYATAIQNVEIVRYLIDNDISLNINNKNGLTPLLMAIQNSNVQIVELLLTSGSNMNAQDNRGNTPLHRAIYIKDESERKELIQLLMKYNANINSQDDRGNTVLHNAVRRPGDRGLIEIIMAYNPDLALKNEDGLNPLELALKIDELDIAKLIMENGGSASESALNAIIHNDLPSIEEYLKKNPKLDYSSNFYGSLSRISLVHLIAFFGNIDTIDLLNKNEFPILCQNDHDITNSAQTSLIHDFASFGRNEMISELLIRGVDVNCPSKSGDTPIIYAALAGQKETVLFLIEKGVDIHLKNKQGGTCLHAACRNGRDDIVQILVERGADVNARGQNDLTPLHLAANEGHETVVKTLIENGADPNLKNNENRAPLDLAKANKQNEVIELLLENMRK